MVLRGAAEGAAVSEGGVGKAGGGSAAVEGVLRELQTALAEEMALSLAMLRQEEEKAAAAAGSSANVGSRFAYTWGLGSSIVRHVYLRCARAVVDSLLGRVLASAEVGAMLEGCVVVLGAMMSTCCLVVVVIVVRTNHGQTRSCVFRVHFTAGTSPCWHDLYTNFVKKRHRADPCASAYPERSLASATPSLVLILRRYVPTCTAHLTPLRNPPTGE